MESNSFYGFDTFNSDGAMYYSSPDTNRLGSEISAVVSTFDHIDADKVYYNGVSLNEVLTSLSNSFNHLQESVIQNGDFLRDVSRDMKIKSRLKRKDLKTLRYGV